MNDRVAREPLGSVLTSVWPTGGHSLDAQLATRDYHPATSTDPALMPPAIAEHAIAKLTRRGDVVLDPDCGAGTTLVEALRVGRHAIGLTAQPRWWHLARANVTATKVGGAPTDGMVLLRRPSTMAAAQTAGLTGRVALLLTALRPTPSINSEEIDDETSGLARLGALLHAYRPLVRPGGHVVITCAPQRHPTRHHLLDLASHVVALGTAAGLAPVARCLALTAGVRGQWVFTRASVAQRRATTRIAHATGHPVALPAHHTALVFRADPDAVDPALAQPIPPLLGPPRWHRPRTWPILTNSNEDSSWSAYPHALAAAGRAA